MTTHDEHVENLGAYALRALPGLEARVLERHLMGCEKCREELQRLQEAADALPRSVTPYEAPPSLKASLMDVVNAEAAGRAAATPAPARRSSARRAWLPRLRPAMGFAAAAATILLAFFAGSQLAGDEEPRTVAAQVDVERLPDGSASLLIPENDGRGAVLRVQGLPQLGPRRTYQVWVQRGSEVVPGPTFEVASDGEGAAAIVEPLEGADAVMVTRERRGGAAAPTEPPVISADV